MTIRFVWNAGKARLNASKHRVTFEEALTVFADPLARIFDDPAHSESETREIVVGQSARGRLLLVSFAQRGQFVRLISARRATRHERKQYEEATSP